MWATWHSLPLLASVQWTTVVGLGLRQATNVTCTSPVRIWCGPACYIRVATVPATSSEVWDEGSGQWSASLSGSVTSATLEEVSGNYENVHNTSVAVLKVAVEVPCFRGMIVGAVPSLGDGDVCLSGDWRQGPIWSTQQATDPYSPFLHAPTTVVDLSAGVAYHRHELALGRAEHGGTLTSINTTLVYASNQGSTIRVELVHPAIGIVGSSSSLVPSVTTDGVVWRAPTFWRPLAHPELGVPLQEQRRSVGDPYADAVMSMLMSFEVDALSVTSPDGTSKWLLLQQPTLRQWWRPVSTHGEAWGEETLAPTCRYTRSKDVSAVAISACQSTVSLHTSSSRRAVSLAPASARLVWVDQLGDQTVGALHVHTETSASVHGILTVVVSDATTYRLEVILGVGRVRSAVVMEINSTAWIGVVCGDYKAESFVVNVDGTVHVNTVAGADQCRSVAVDCSECQLLVVGNSSWTTVDVLSPAGTQATTFADPGPVSGSACSWSHNYTTLTVAVCSSGVLVLGTNTTGWRFTAMACVELHQGLGSSLCVINNGTSTLVVDLEADSPGASQYGAVASVPVGVYVTDPDTDNEPEMIVITASERLLRYRFELDAYHTPDFVENSLKPIPLHPTARVNAMSGTFAEIWGTPKTNSTADGASVYFTLGGDASGNRIAPSPLPAYVTDPEASYVLPNATRVVMSEGGVLVDYNTSNLTQASDLSAFPLMTMHDSTYGFSELIRLIYADVVDTPGVDALFVPSLFDIGAPTSAEGWARWQRRAGLESTGHVRVIVVGASSLCNMTQRGWIVPRHEAVCDDVDNRSRLQVGSVEVRLPLAPLVVVASTFECLSPFFFWNGTACKKTIECDIELVAPTSISDRVCKPKPTCGTLSYLCGTESCCPLTQCRRGVEYSPIGPTATTDRVCVPTTTSCTHPSHRVLQPDAPRGTTVFADGCRPCPAGTTSWHTLDNPHTSRVCLNISRVGVKYASRGHTWFDSVAHETDRSINITASVKTCTTCSAMNGFVVNQTCTLTTDTVCQAVAPVSSTMAFVSRQGRVEGSNCNAGFYMNAGGVCERCTVCKHNMYDSACTTTRDAVCTPYSVIDFAVLVTDTLYPLLVISVMIYYVQPVA